MRAILPALLVSPLLGYDLPSLPGESERRRRKTAKCPCGRGKLKQERDGSYSCSKCGHVTYELPPDH
jgi:hypothetical protein